MEAEKDIFGLAIKDYLSGERGNVIKVDTNLTEDEELPVDYLFRTKEELPEWEKMALFLCKGKILDVGAGAGCHSKILQKDGFDVTPIDIAPLTVHGMLSQGIDNARVQNYFSVEEKYDTLLFLMNGIGLAKTTEGLNLVFDKAKQILNAGGQILLESSDILYMYEEEDGSVVIDLNDRYYGEMTYELSYKGIVSEAFNWLYVDYNILKDKAEQAGFNVELLHQGEEGNYLAKLTYR